MGCLAQIHTSAFALQAVIDDVERSGGDQADLDSLQFRVRNSG